jgi:hypothetical protein
MADFESLAVMIDQTRVEMVSHQGSLASLVDSNQEGTDWRPRWILSPHVWKSTKPRKRHHSIDETNHEQMEAAIRPGQESSSGPS